MSSSSSSGASGGGDTAEGIAAVRSLIAKLVPLCVGTPNKGQEYRDLTTAVGLGTTTLDDRSKDALAQCLQQCSAESYRFFFLLLAALQGYQVVRDTSAAELTSVLLWFLSQPASIGTILLGLQQSKTPNGADRFPSFDSQEPLNPENWETLRAMFQTLHSTAALLAPLVQETVQAQATPRLVPLALRAHVTKDEDMKQVLPLLVDRGIAVAKRMEHYITLLRSAYASADTAVRALRLQEQQTLDEKAKEEEPDEYSTDSDFTASRTGDSSVEGRLGTSAGPACEEKEEEDDEDEEDEEDSDKTTVDDKTIDGSFGELFKLAEHELRWTMSRVLDQLESASSIIHGIKLDWKTCENTDHGVDAKQEAIAVDNLWDDLLRSHETEVGLMPSTPGPFNPGPMDVANDYTRNAPTAAPPLLPSWGVSGAVSHGNHLDRMPAAERLRITEATLARDVESELAMLQHEMALFEGQMKTLGLMHLIVQLQHPNMVPQLGVMACFT